MKIAVILRMVPDLVEELPLLDGQVAWDEVMLTLNEFDDHALEEAVLLKEETGAQVVALALSAGGDRVLRTAIARGADRAVQVVADGTEGASARSIAPLFAEVVRAEQADLVLTGVQAPGDLFGGLVPFLAAALGWPAADGVTSLSLSAGRVRVVQECGAGRMTLLLVTPPAAFGVQAARQPPRYVSGSRLRQVARTAAITSITPAAGLADEPARLLALSPPRKVRSVTFVGDDPDAAAAEILVALRARGMTGRQDG